jgi:hypothetical protein
VPLVQISEVFQEVSELYSTETCSVCLVKSGPSGVKSLKIRETESLRAA